MLEKILQFVTYNSEPMIQWLFLAILLLSGALIARGLFSKKEELAPASGLDGLLAQSELQSTLTKIMEQTAKLESVKLGELSPAGLEQVNLQVEELKKDLQSKEDEIAALKKGGNAQPSADAGALASRIKELESKLSNYEILEDDIADLSKFKEENARLRQEIESLKVTGGAPGPDGSVKTEFAPSEAPKPSVPNVGDPMADFEQTLKMEKELTSEAKAAAPTEAPPVAAEAAQAPSEPAPEVTAAAPAAEAAAPAAPTAEEPLEKDDIFAEYVSGPQEEVVDTAKMLNEMADLSAVAPVAPTEGTALNEALDTEKMAAEADDLTKKA